MRIIYLIDFNCPFSYIGLHRLKKAVSELNLNVEWEMRSFELEDLPDDEVTSTTERYAVKYQLSPEDAEKKIREIEEIASGDGLNINFKDLKLTSSANAHRLVKYCENKHPEITLKLVCRIFHANFVKNSHISDIDTLTEISKTCDLNEDEVRRVLESNSYGIEAYLDREEALFNGINTTPYFIVSKKGERLMIPGVFSTEEFKTALKDLNSGEINKKSFI